MSKPTDTELVIFSLTKEGNIRIEFKDEVLDDVNTHQQVYNALNEMREIMFKQAGIKVQKVFLLQGMLKEPVTKNTIIQ